MNYFLEMSLAIDHLIIFLQIFREKFSSYEITHFNECRDEATKLFIDISFLRQLTDFGIIYSSAYNNIMTFYKNYFWILIINCDIPIEISALYLFEKLDNVGVIYWENIQYSVIEELIDDLISKCILRDDDVYYESDSHEDMAMLYRGNPEA